MFKRTKMFMIFVLYFIERHKIPRKIIKIKNKLFVIDEK